ncbi:MAG: DUF1574 domain-containing protein, partial [Candidatus Hydrogenedentes bacterium]|nr:DUF1574 domain-containing protein [Candidatus Hydrogenedentota bacterium]
MRKLLLKGMLFLALNAALSVVVLHLHASTLTTVPWETDSVLMAMPSSAHTDLIFLGTSRTYLLSRFREHHEMVEKTLGRNVFNMALPQGGGITPARFYLETFWEQGNTTDRIVYFLDPFVLYSPGANENHKFVYFEPFRIAFLAKLVRNHYPYRRIITYVRSKFSAAWLFRKPRPLIHHIAALSESEYTEERIALRLDSLYPDGLPEDVFATYTAEFEHIIALCEKHDTPLTVIVPPTLLGPEPGHDAMIAWLRKLAEKGGIAVRDWVEAMP